jgi:hypothetical protein
MLFLILRLLAVTLPLAFAWPMVSAFICSFSEHVWANGELFFFKFVEHVWANGERFYPFIF